MLIGDVMTLRLVSVRPDESVHVAIARMLEENVGSVVVCEESRLLGMFTERDVLRLTGQEGGIGDARVGDVMSRPVVWLDPDDDILAAAELMAERRIRHLPVVVDGNALGVVGMRDIMRFLIEVLWRERDPKVREMARELLRRG
jgi:CBS domain-containing protein